MVVGIEMQGEGYQVVHNVENTLLYIVFLDQCREDCIKSRQGRGEVVTSLM